MTLKRPTQKKFLLPLDHTQECCFPARQGSKTSVPGSNTESVAAGKRSAEAEAGQPAVTGNICKDKIPHHKGKLWLCYLAIIFRSNKFVGTQTQLRSLVAVSSSTRVIQVSKVFIGH